MRKTEIERVINKGSVRQKIKLYFTDLAHFNTVGILTAEVKGSGGGATLERKSQILTDRERDLIFKSLKDPEDIQYYKDLRTWNKAFLMFKPSISSYTRNFEYLTAQLSKYAVVRLLHSGYEDAINDMLEKVEDKKLREELLAEALQSLKMFKAHRYQEKDSPPFVEIPETTTTGNILILVEVLNEKVKEAKKYLEEIRTFLNAHLALQPYSQFLKEEEDKIIAEVEKCRELIGLEDERFNILRWEEVEASFLT